MTEIFETPSLAALRERRIRILVTNDDGINAPGLAALERIAAAITSDVWVVAPEAEQSGASHSLTLHIPLRMRQIAARRFAVLGTPTDCVMMGNKYVIPNFGTAEGDPKPPDLVLSGVNRGSNIADDVTYSGTVAGAMEGCALGIPAIALSQSFGWTNGPEVRWGTCEHHGPALIARLLEAGWARDVLINVNFPDVPHSEVAGVAVTRQGRSDTHGTRIIAREDARGVPYYWLGFERSHADPPDGSDLHAMRNSRISVTPLHLNLTYDAALTSLSEAVAGPTARLAQGLESKKR